MKQTISVENIDATQPLVVENAYTFMSEGSTDYALLANKPSINGVVLEGNKTSAQLNIKQSYTADEITSAGTTNQFVTTVEKAAWNSKSDFSGSYDDLTDTPVIPATLAELTDDETHRVVTDVEKGIWNAKQDALTADTDYLTPSTASSTYEPLLPSTPLVPATKFLNGNKQWAEMVLGSSGYASNVYMTNTISSIVGTYKQSSSLNDVSEITVSTTCNNNEVLAETYLFENEIGTTYIDAGTWRASLFSAIDAAAGDTYFKFEIFARTVGGTENVLFSSYSHTIENRAGYEGYMYNTIETTQPSFTVNTTDRIGHRIYVKTTAAGERTLSYKVGDGNASYINTPLALRHSQLRDKNSEEAYQHVTQTEISTWNAKIAKTTNVTAINDANIADGEIVVFNLTNKDMRTSDKTIVTTLGTTDTTVPTSKAVKDAITTAITSALGGSY